MSSSLPTSWATRRSIGQALTTLGTPWARMRDVFAGRRARFMLLPEPSSACAIQSRLARTYFRGSHPRRRRVTTFGLSR